MPSTLKDPNLLTQEQKLQVLVVTGQSADELKVKEQRDRLAEEKPEHEHP